MSEKSLEEEIKIKAGQARRVARYMSSTEDLVELQIQKAQESGKFNNLEGMGKPLDLEENAFEPEELRMAFRILKRNNFAPYWVELGKQIDHDIENFWEEVEYFKKYRDIFHSKRNSESAIKRFEIKQNKFIKDKKEVLETINKKINEFNLQSPTFHLTRGNLKIDEEMSKLRKILNL